MGYYLIETQHFLRWMALLVDQDWHLALNKGHYWVLKKKKQNKKKEDIIHIAIEKLSLVCDDSS